jgi:LmbE family N-acetylglucosaminyl deacetylase
MKRIHELLAGRRVGALTAHPDDDIILVHGLYAANEVSDETHELTLTRGRDSALNWRANEQPPFDVAAGDRLHEGLRGAARLGFSTNTILDLSDGRLASEAAEAVEHTAAWLVRRRVDILMTLGGLADHADHTAIGAIGRLAAMQATLATGRPIGILEVRSDGRGDVLAKATPEGIELAYEAAREHGSQFGNDPRAVRELAQYPIEFPATYTYHTTGNLAIAIRTV